MKLFNVTVTDATTDSVDCYHL